MKLALPILSFGIYAAIFIAAAGCFTGHKSIVCDYRDPSGLVGLDWIVARKP